MVQQADILIVDDNEMNRDLLENALGFDYLSTKRMYFIILWFIIQQNTKDDQEFIYCLFERIW